MTPRQLGLEMLAALLPHRSREELVAQEAHIEQGQHLAARLRYAKEFGRCSRMSRHYPLLCQQLSETVFPFCHHITLVCQSLLEATLSFLLNTCY